MKDCVPIFFASSNGNIFNLGTSASHFLLVMPHPSYRDEKLVVVRQALLLALSIRMPLAIRVKKKSDSRKLLATRSPQDNLPLGGRESKSHCLFAPASICERVFR
jgi:hypothetical protein